MNLDAIARRSRWRGQKESRLEITGLEAGAWSRPDSRGEGKRATGPWATVQDSMQTGSISWTKSGPTREDLTSLVTRARSA